MGEDPFIVLIFLRHPLVLKGSFSRGFMRLGISDFVVFPEVGHIIVHRVRLWGSWLPREEWLALLIDLDFFRDVPGSVGVFSIVEVVERSGDVLVKAQIGNLVVPGRIFLLRVGV